MVAATARRWITSQQATLPTQIPNAMFAIVFMVTPLSTRAYAGTNVWERLYRGRVSVFRMAALREVFFI